MARHHPPTCRYCGASRYDGENISARGLCERCALAREATNIVHLRERSGVFYVHWLRRSLLATHRDLVAADRPPVGS